MGKEKEITFEQAVMNAEMAKEYLGWRETTEKDKNKKLRAKSVETGKSVWIALDNNIKNRPFRKSLSDAYKAEMLRKKWMLTPDMIAFDYNGQLLTGQHRLVALIYAEKARAENVTYYRYKYGWRGEVTAEFLVARGFNPKCADFVDLGQKRTGGDVLFRRKEFNESQYKESEIKKLSNDLATAARLVWIRTNGKQVSDAPKFPHSEMLDFLKEHPLLVKCVEQIYKIDTGNDEKDQIRRYLSRAYAAALAYLMGHCKSDPEATDTSEKPKELKKALDFWDVFGFGPGDPKGDDLAIQTLINAYVSRRKNGKTLDRDETVGLAVKAWNAFIDGDTKFDSRKIKLTKKELEKGGAPRIGGFDTVYVPPVEDDEEEEEEVEEEEYSDDGIEVEEE